MCREYNIDCLGEKVGTASVKKEGLYFSILCKCYFPKEGIYKIDILCGEKTLHLGTCIPEGKAYVLQRRISAKSLPERDLKFQTNIPCHRAAKNLTAVATDKPFPYISKLKEGRLVMQDGETFISF